jgi:hypothetical protein
MPHRWLYETEIEYFFRSSTETEVVGVDDFMPSILWTRYFLLAQGYNVTDNVLAQDNKSSMLLEKNGKASSSKRTKHVTIRYFFATDKIAKGELIVEWCPTLEMIGDYMTKPLQGHLFIKFRDLIMGVVSAISMSVATNSRKPKKTKKKSPPNKGMTSSQSKEQCHRSVRVGSNGKIVIHPEHTVLVISDKCHQVNMR